MLRNRAPSAQARAVFVALLEQPSVWRHGYDLAKRAGLSSGTLYPLLIRLHAREFLDAKWLEPERGGRPPRHVYRLTASGAAFARESLAAQPDGTEAFALGQKAPA